jgi:uncharacterized protein involved in exopolysaccharide biosynthesis
MPQSPSEPSPTNRDGVLYVMPQALLGPGTDDEIDLLDLWRILWGSKWLIIGITALFAVAAVIYALTATELYRASVLLAPTEQKSSPAIGGQLGGRSNSAEAIAVLKSREFTRAFIEDKNLMPLLFEGEWDADSKRWKATDPQNQPDIRDAIKLFQETILQVEEDGGTGQVVLNIQWTDPETAAAWANELVERVNARMRERDLREAEANIKYLEQQLLSTSMITLQNTVGRLLESELQKAMLARGNEEYSFRVIDPAVPPKDRVWPKRTLIVIVATMLGGIIAVFAAFIVHAIRKHGTREQPQRTAA